MPLKELYKIKDGIDITLSGIPEEVYGKRLEFVKRYANHGLPVLEVKEPETGTHYMVIENYLEIVNEPNIT